MTSNIGSDIIYKSGLGFKEEKDLQLITEHDMRERVMSSLRENFKPEFLNRLDEVIIFHPISQAMLKKIVDLQLILVQKRLKEKNIKLVLSAKTKEYLSKKGYDPSFGARPLKRVIQNDILDELALQIIEDKIRGGATVKIDVKNDKVVFA